MDNFEALEKAMCHELGALEQKVKNGTDMSVQDLDKVDKLVHALKSLATYRAMKEAEEYEMDGMSGRRGRAANGRYVSRDGGQSYTDGYSQGFAEGMRQGSSYREMPMHGGFRY